MYVQLYAKMSGTVLTAGGFERLVDNGAGICLTWSNNKNFQKLWDESAVKCISINRMMRLLTKYHILLHLLYRSQMEMLELVFCSLPLSCHLFAMEWDIGRNSSAEFPHYFQYQPHWEKIAQRIGDDSDKCWLFGFIHFFRMQVNPLSSYWCS